MAPEKQLINARALMEYARNQKSGTIDCNDIARFPTVDAVEVVRCKDCLHSRELFDTTHNKPFWACSFRDHSWRCVRASDFCSYGERRTDNEKI